MHILSTCMTHTHIYIYDIIYNYSSFHSRSIIVFNATNTRDITAVCVTRCGNRELVSLFMCNYKTYIYNIAVPIIICRPETT